MMTWNNLHDLSVDLVVVVEVLTSVAAMVIVVASMMLPVVALWLEVTLVFDS